MKRNNRELEKPDDKNSINYDIVFNNTLNKLKKDLMNVNEILHLKQIATLNKQKLILILKKEIGLNCKKINVIENNNIFNQILDGIDCFKNNNPTLEIKTFLDSLSIKRNNIEEFNFHFVIKFSLTTGSYISISSTPGDSIEITSISVLSNKKRQGEGSKLMNLVFELCHSQLGYRPRFVLECTGFLNSSKADIRDQISFFRKFGFRVENKKYYPNYVMMSSNKSTYNQNEGMNQKAA